jgi:HD-like signal output (HDOD) protein
MPVFAHTARDISEVAANRDSSAAELARVVLQDAAMTARLLRVANSPVFNPAGKTVSTVSRAVVVLGFQEVRSICLSIAVVESLLGGRRKRRVCDEMARSFHAAVQARSFARRRKDSSPEEVFIATLLCRLGDMAFWAFADASADAMDAALQQRPGDTPVTVQRDVLGFAFRDLTLSLSREWKLGGLLEQSLEGKSDRNPRVGNVVLGYQLAVAAERGWRSPAVKALLERIAENLYLPLDAVEELVRHNAAEAARTAGFFGAGLVGELIPVPGDRREQPTNPLPERRAPLYLEPDPLLQLTILRELSALMDSSPDINSVLEIVLEGMYRGIGMDRTVFALCSRDYRFLAGRYALGVENEALRRAFHFETGASQPDLFSRVIESRRAIWLQRTDTDSLQQLLTPRISAVTRGADCFVTPIEIRGKVIGVFYGDRQSSGRPLDEECFNSFRHFAQQGNLALSYLSGG